MQFRKQNKQINFATCRHSYNLLLNTNWTVSIILAPLRKVRNKTNYYIAIPQKDTEPADPQANLLKLSWKIEGLSVRMLSLNSISLSQYCSFVQTFGNWLSRVQLSTTRVDQINRNIASSSTLCSWFVKATWYEANSRRCSWISSR